MASAGSQAQAAVSTAAADVKDAKKESKDAKDAKNNRLYLRWEITDEMIAQLFGKFGKVQDPRVVRGRCFGFVTFENEADAAKALAALNGQALQAPLTLEVASSERKRQRRPARTPAERKDKKDEKREDKKDEKDSKPRTRRPRRERQPAAETTDKGTEEAEEKGSRKQRRRRARRVYNPDYEGKDPNFGKIVKLVPDPTKTDVAQDAKLVDVRCNQRTFRNYTNIKPISTLVLKADPKKGPFKCDFKLDQFDLKLLQVKVTPKAGDTRVACRVAYPAAREVGDAYMRTMSGSQDIRSRNFHLKRPQATDDLAYFLGIDRILMDPVTGLWKELVLSLCSAQTPKDAPADKKDAKA